MKDAGNRVYELLVMSLVASFVIAVSCACIVTSSRISRTAYVQDVSVSHMQTAADLAAAGKGNMTPLMDFYGQACTADGNGGAVVHFGSDMQPVDVTEPFQYLIRVGAPARDGFLGMCSVTLEQADGSLLWDVTASWQEEVYHGKAE